MCKNNGMLIFCLPQPHSETQFARVAFGRRFPFPQFKPGIIPFAESVHVLFETIDVEQKKIFAVIVETVAFVGNAEIAAVFVSVIGVADPSFGAFAGFIRNGYVFVNF
jgi:hypothetical protein